MWFLARAMLLGRKPKFCKVVLMVTRPAVNRKDAGSNPALTVLMKESTILGGGEAAYR